MRVLLCALATTCSVVSLTAQQRAISDSDLFAFRWVASPQISPDGRQAAYVLVTVNAKHDGYETSLWLVNTDGASPPRRLTAGPRDGAPRWSPDGSTLAFVRPTDGRPQLYLLPLSGGEAQQLTDLPKGASPAAWSPDGKTIAFTSTTTAEDLAKKEKDKSEEAKSDVRIVTEAEFRADDEGYADPTEHAHIWTVPAGMPGDAPAKGRQVTSGEFDENAPQWSRDGTRIYFVSDRVRESYYYPPDNNFYSVPAAGGSASLDTVVDVNGPVFGPAVAPDGKTVAFRGWVNPRAVRSYNQSDLFVSRDGRARNLTADYDFDMGAAARRRRVEPRHLDGGRQVGERDHDRARPLEPRAVRRAERRARAGHHRGSRRPRLYRHARRPPLRPDDGRPDAPRRGVRARCADEAAHPAHARERLAPREAPARDARGLLVPELRRQEDRDVDHEAGGLHARQEVPPDPQHPRRPAHRLRLHLFPRDAADGRPRLCRGLPQPAGDHHVRPGVQQQHSVQVSRRRLQGPDGRGGFRDPARVRGFDQAGRDGRIGRRPAHRLDRGPHAPLRGHIALRRGGLHALPAIVVPFHPVPRSRGVPGPLAGALRRLGHHAPDVHPGRRGPSDATNSGRRGHVPRTQVPAPDDRAGTVSGRGGRTVAPPQAS